MYPLSSFLIDQTVTLTLTVWTTDADGGRIPLSQTTRPGIPAAVLPGKPVRLVSYEPDSGLRRVTTIWPASVEFPDDAALNVDDTIAWTDDAGTVHTYQVEGYGSTAGQPPWVATCKEVM